MAKLTNTQLIVLSAASQRDDRAVELPENIRSKAAQNGVDKLIRAGLLEEVSATGSLPIWRRDDSSGPMALRITRAGLEAIDAADETTAAPQEIRVRPAATREVATAAPEAIVSRKRISVVAQKSARKRHRLDKVKTATKTGPLRDSRPGSIAEFEPGEGVSAGSSRGVLPSATAAQPIASVHAGVNRSAPKPERTPRGAPADIESTEPEPVASIARELEPPASAIIEPALAKAVNAEPTPTETKSAAPGPATSAPSHLEPSTLDSVLAEAGSAEPMRTSHAVTISPSVATAENPGAERRESSARASVTMLDTFGFLTVMSFLMRGAAALNVAWTNWIKRYLTLSAEIFCSTGRPSATDKSANLAIETAALGRPVVQTARVFEGERGPDEDR